MAAMALAGTWKARVAEEHERRDEHPDGEEYHEHVGRCREQNTNETSRCT